MDLDYLADYSQHLRELAEWHHQEWSYLRPGEILEARIERLKGRCGRCAIPTVIIAHESEMLVGSAMLVDHDMDIRMELSPWLAGVYVRPENRGSGIGTALVRRVVQEAAVLNIRKLYLYTPDREKFYQRLGWSTHERVGYRGTTVAIMSIAIHRSP